MAQNCTANRILRSVFLIGITAGLVGCQTQAPVETAAAPTHEAMVGRGGYLVTIVGCNDCHTPFKMEPNGPEPDRTRMPSGHPEGFKVPPPPKLVMDGWAWAGTATNTAFVGPWGITCAANLTPGQNTGLGIWD